jgi:hypothetical protein
MPSEKYPRPVKKNWGEETAGGRREERGVGDKDGSLEASCELVGFVRLVGLCNKPNGGAKTGLGDEKGICAPTGGKGGCGA